MPDLNQTFLKYDLGQLQIVAERWGLELESQDLNSAAEELSAALLDLEAVSETIDILPAPARSVLQALIETNGKMEWVIFARTHGEIREMGAGKREREQPHKKTISPAETLFYYGFLAKAFFDTEKGSQEFAYIPDDFLQVIEELNVETNEAQPSLTAEPLGRPATPVEKNFEMLATDHVLDDATTHLAALRLNIEFDNLADSSLQNLLSTASLIQHKTLQPEAVKKFLEASREDALKTLYQAWLGSTTFDELRRIPTLVCEGEWKTQPQVTREFIMNLIQAIPQGKWWSLTSFIKTIKEKYPDFQRPAGDYDSWFIKRASDGQYLRGFAYWDAVDGALIKFMIETLHWLGQVDLASPEDGKEVTAFRVKSRVAGQKVDGKLSVSSNGKITVSRYFSRAARYQIARFCDWGEEKQDEYIYSVSAKSLKRAVEQGLKAEQLLNLLVKYTNSNVSPALVKALKRWDANGTEARVETLLVLRVRKPEIMEEIRQSKAGKFLGELLSPTAVVVKAGASQKVMEALTDLGLLTEIINQGD
ncbi:MAG: helicase-associated domain-containing protein [Anaerolineales bacterium]|nr:helicase-associated domain-containing protein [Anaerolineales bacterium]